MKIIYVILFSAVLIIPGCYTILEHPDISSKDENGFVYHDDVKFYDDCGSCHSADDEAIMSSNPSMFRTYRHQRAQSTYGNDVYYSDDFFGGYGYYYNTPWWYDVSKSGSGKNESSKNQEQTRNSARNNSGSRSDDNEREAARNSSGGSGLNYTSPTRSSNSGSGSSGNTTETSKPSSSSNDSSSGNRSTSDQPKSRDNSGNRSSGSGRR